MPSLGVVPMIHYRLTALNNNIGGQTLVGYDLNQCTQAASSTATTRHRIPTSATPCRSLADSVGSTSIGSTRSPCMISPADRPRRGVDHDYSTAGSSTNVLWHHDSTAETVSMDAR